MAARMISPRTSSTTAAPRMIRASLPRDFPMSWRTRAVMPTLVAHRVAPRKAWVCQELPGNEPGPDQPPEGEGRGDAQHRHEERGEPHAQDVPDRRLQPHLEQEHHHADPGEQVDAGIGRDPLEAVDARKGKIAEENPRQELPEDRRLPEHDGQVSHELRGHEDHDEVQKERDGGVLPRRERDRGEQEDGGEEQDPVNGIFLNMRPLLFIDAAHAHPNPPAARIRTRYDILLP